MNKVKQCEKTRSGRVCPDWIEVLAPAGSFASLEAAVKAGADAVYAGGDRFGARAYAGNFGEEEMLWAIDYVHLHGKQLYMTVNTLFKQDEIGELYEYLLPFYREGLDAVIVQDVGAAAMIREEFPELDLHASTQMTVTGAQGAAFLEELGFTRVVPARELSCGEIARIRKQTNLEIETFVHGALCFSYSGQCLMSSMLGGRSGNRGRCAQPCRLPYDLYEGRKKLNHHQERYLLSPRDLCSLEILPQIFDAGVNSLKIEGRMKKPEYVAAVTRQYRRYTDLYLEQADRFRTAPEDIQELMELYNRGGFTRGYYGMHNGREMMSMKRPNHMGYYVGKIQEIRGNKIRFRCETDIHRQDVLEITLNRENKVELTSPVDAAAGSMVSLNASRIRQLKPGMPIYRTRNQKLIGEIQDQVLRTEKKEKIKGIVTFIVGKPVMMQVWKDSLSVTVSGDEVMQAQRQPVTEEDLCRQLKKTGGTPFLLEIEEVRMEGEGFLPMGAVKELRRNALEELEKAIIGRHFRPQGQPLQQPSPASEGSGRDQRIAMVSSPEQAEAALSSPQIDVLYVEAEMLPFEEWEAFTRCCHDAGREIYYAMPYIFRDRAVSEWEQYQELIVKGRHDGILVRTIDEFAFIRGLANYRKTLVLDSSLYAYNSAAEAFYRHYAGGPVRFILPQELNASELRALERRDADLYVYGRQPLMISAQCQVKNHLGCRQQEKFLTLRDRYQKEFPVRNHCRYCYNVIYNGEPLRLTDESGEIRRLGTGGRIWRFTTESGEEVRAVLENRMKGKYYTKGHWKRGIE